MVSYSRVSTRSSISAPSKSRLPGLLPGAEKGLGPCWPFSWPRELEGPSVDRAEHSGGRIAEEMLGRCIERWLRSRAIVTPVGGDVECRHMQRLVGRAGNAAANRTISPGFAPP